ncbi:MAG TPA: hypothetical protein VH482_34820 [Thermomicrobiales bacterium]|jgi:hypothetical protein
MLLPVVLPAGDVPELMRSLGPLATTAIPAGESTSTSTDSRPFWIGRLLLAVRGELLTARPQQRPILGLRGEER